MKKVYFECMRIIACGLVIFNHLKGYTLYMNSTGIKQAFYMVLTMITRINVPIFFMISGAVLLGKRENFTTVIKKRISRFLLVLFIFELGIYVGYYINALNRGEFYDFTVKRFIYGILSEGLDGTSSYWYLYSYLVLLFTLPFMQRISEHIEKQDICILLFLHFMFSSFIPMLNVILQMTGNRGISITGNFYIPFVSAKQFFYPLLGYYFEYYVDIELLSRKKIAGLCAAAGAGVILSCLCTFYEGETMGTYTQNYVQLFDYLSTIAFFIIIKYMVVVVVPKISEGKISKIICLVGSLTFGIYLLDPYFKLILYKRYEAFAGIHFPVLLVSIGWCILSMVCGGIVTLALKKVPTFKRIL